LISFDLANEPNAGFNARPRWLGSSVGRAED
jgi:aryl-phospho-beta-D-glucosidase BglC (GH1 family)